MTVSSMITIVQKIIDISLVWIIIYTVLKGLKNNVKMVMLLKGALIIIIVKALSDYFNLLTIGIILDVAIVLVLIVFAIMQVGFSLISFGPSFSLI